MSLIKNIFGIIFAIALVAFAISNRQDTTLIYSPVHEAMTVPLYFITLIFLGAGFLLGAATVWLNSGHIRKTKRQQKRQIKALEKELENIKTTPKIEKTATPADELFPALPKANNQ